MKQFQKYLYLLLLFITAICSCNLSKDTHDDNTWPVYDGSCPDIENLQVFPASNPWNYPVSGLATHPDSNNYINNLIGAGSRLHTDFGNDTYNGSYIGIPYIVIYDDNPKAVKITFQYAGESDPGPYYIPDGAPIEGQGPDVPVPSGDRHVLVIHEPTQMLYELYGAVQLDHLKWKAGSGAIYDLTKTELRPIYWTSADAAGLPIFPYLVRYEEIEKGMINHAIRFTLQNSKIRDSFISPARHSANHSTSTDLLPMGVRLRLKPGFDISGFSRTNQIILTAMKEYGIILADNGADMFISGAPDPRWDNTDLHNLCSVTAGDFEVVDFNEADVVDMPY